MPLKLSSVVRSTMNGTHCRWHREEKKISLCIFNRTEMISCHDMIDSFTIFFPFVAGEEFDVWIPPSCGSASCDWWENTAPQMRDTGAPPTTLGRYLRYMKVGEQQEFVNRPPPLLSHWLCCRTIIAIMMIAIVVSCGGRRRVIFFASCLDGTRWETEPSDTGWWKVAPTWFCVVAECDPHFAKRSLK